MKKFERKMEREQTSSQPISEKFRREKIVRAKRKFRSERQNLSFNEKMQIAFALSERDEKLKKAKKRLK
jgi:hypothetical protein